MISPMSCSVPDIRRNGSPRQMHSRAVLIGAAAHLDITFVEQIKFTGELVGSMGCHDHLVGIGRAVCGFDRSRQGKKEIDTALPTLEPDSLFRQTLNGSIGLKARDLISVKHRKIQQRSGDRADMDRWSRLCFARLPSRSCCFALSCSSG